ncbi:MAG TPA: hypothetical protein PLL75_00185 [Candidatus Omnitrophota bacterium]|nr:hypothetical protein [Candidatus Omnitrophota bacterium]HPS36135.1 hypothetical protein [Candidatus Omnitrophota bacterium]
MKKRKKKTLKKEKKEAGSLKDVLSIYSKIADLKKEVGQLSDARSGSEERLTDLEVHINLLTRLLTTLCVEKFGIRVATLKRLVKRIEKEAVRDSQIMELESLYNLSHVPSKKPQSSQPKVKGDPWEKIS